MNIVIGSSIGGACIIYEIVAVIGYLTFGSRVDANIMIMYPATSLFIACGQLAIVVLVLFSYPLQVHPCRNCLDKIVHHITSEKDASVAAPRPISTEEDDSAHEYGVPSRDDTSPLRHTLLTASIIIFGFTIAYFISSLHTGEALCFVFTEPELG
jgi:amino acid permease